MDDSRQDEPCRRVIQGVETAAARGCRRDPFGLKCPITVARISRVFVRRLGARPLCDGSEYSAPGLRAIECQKHLQGIFKGMHPYGLGPRPACIKLERAHNLHSPHYTMAVRVGPIRDPSWRRPHIFSIRRSAPSRPTSSRKRGNKTKIKASRSTPCIGYPPRHLVAKIPFPQMPIIGHFIGARYGVI